MREDAVSPRQIAGEWVMMPLINASDFEASGTIAGALTLGEDATLPACGGAETTLADFVPVALADELKKSGNANEDGSYMISFVDPGSYDLGYEGVVTFDNGESLSFTADHPAGVSVSSGAVASADFTIISVSCGS